MNQEEILNFFATLDHQLLIAVLVLLCLLFLIWRLMTRTARLERDMNRLGERLTSLREETRAVRAGALSVAPSKADPSAEDVTEVDEPIYYQPTEAELPEEDDVLQRAVASFEEEKGFAMEGGDEGEDAFEDGETKDDDSFALTDNEKQAGEDSSLRDDDRFVPEAAEASSEESSLTYGQAPPAAEESGFEREAQGTEEAVEGKPAVTGMPEESSGVARLEKDPARPEVGLVRCLSCNYKLAYPDKLAGKRVRCPSCRASLTLP